MNPAPKRALIITGRYPLGVNGGDTERCRQLIKYLSSCCYEVDILALSDARIDIPTFSRDISSQRIISHSSTFSKVYALLRLVKLHPMQSSYYINRQTLKQLKKTDFRPYDVIVIHLARLYRFVDYIPKDKAIIIDLCDILTINYRKAWRSHGTNLAWRTVSFIEWRLMKRLEIEILKSNFTKTVISRRDYEYAVKSLYSSPTSLHILPNAVNNTKQPTVASISGRYVLFIGNMQAAHNLTAINYLVSQDFHKRLVELGLELLLVGRMTLAQTRHYESVGIQVRPNPVLISDALENIFCGIAPLSHCAGMQNKIIDYIQFQIPVIASDNSAEGLDLSSNEHYLSAYKSDEVLAAIRQLQGNPLMYERLPTAAHSKISTMFDQATLNDRFLQIVKDV